MTLVELARKLRPLIVKAAQSLTDEEAEQAAMLYDEWQPGFEYEAGYKVRYDGITYKCLTAHTALETWNPLDSPSLWAKVLTSDSGAVLPWEQPDSTNPYSKGDKVTHGGKTWVSNIDGNVWEPGVYGWSETE